MLVQIINYIILPLVIAYIATVMTKKKEVELEAHGQLLKHRIRAYVDVYRFMRQNEKLIVVPRVEENLYFDCLDGSDYKIGTQGLEYVSYLRSIDHINKYKSQLEQLTICNELYLEPYLRMELVNLQQWLSHLTQLLTAFKATLAEEKWKFDKATRESKLRYACSLMAIALQDDIQSFSNNIEPTIAKKLRHPKLSHWSFDSSCQVDQSSYTHSQLATHTPDLIVRLCYLHYSDRCTPTEFDELPEEKRMQMIESFFTSFQRNLQ